MMKYLDLDGARYIVATIQNLLDGKVSKDGSKVLSTNDYTTTEKNKLAGIAANATKVETSTTIGNLKINGTEKQIIPLMTAASSTAAGKAGLVPAPAQNKHTSFLRGDGTWVIPTNTTYTNATTSKDGLMSSEDKTKLDGIAANANNYVHPSTHAASMITQDATHRFVSDTEKTTWNGKASKSVATTSADGLMSSEDKTKLDGIATGANKYVHPTTSGNKHIPSGGSAGQVLKWSADGVAVWGTDNNTTYSNMTGATSSAAGKAGLVPAPASGKQSSYLRGDGTWAVPTNTTYSDMEGATSSAAGTHGLVPAPAAGANTKYLRGDGTWQTPPNTTYSLATSSSNGLLSSGDFTKLSKVTATEMGYLDGVTSSIQTQLNNKLGKTEKASSATTADKVKYNLIINDVTYNGSAEKEFTVPDEQALLKRQAIDLGYAALSLMTTSSLALYSIWKDTHAISSDKTQYTNGPKIITEAEALPLIKSFIQDVIDITQKFTDTADQITGSINLNREVTQLDNILTMMTAQSSSAIRQLLTLTSFDITYTANMNKMLSSSQTSNFLSSGSIYKQTKDVLTIIEGLL